MKNYFSSACTVTDIIIFYYHSKKRRLSMLRLQYLLYLLYCDYYEKYRKLLFAENFYTTSRGPEIKEIGIIYSDDDLDNTNDEYYSTEEADIILPLLKQYDDSLISELIYFCCCEGSPYLAIRGYNNHKEELISPSLIMEYIDTGEIYSESRQSISECSTHALETPEIVLRMGKDEIICEPEKLIVEAHRPKYKSPLKITYNNFGMISKTGMQNILNLDLPGIDFKILFLMLSETQPITGSVCFSDGKPITKEWICIKVNKSEKTVRRSLQTLQDKELIKKMTDNNCVKYYVNPYIFVRSQKINEYLYNMFKDTVWHKYYLKKIKNPKTT